MSQNDDLYDDGYDSENDETDAPPAQTRNPLRAEIKRLQKELKEANTSASEGAQAKREIAFLKAGVNPDDPKARYFVKGYEGDLTPDAIKAAAVEIGLADPPEDPANTVTAEEQAAHQRIAGTSAGGQSTGTAGIEAEIAEATRAGQHLRAINLKQQLAAQTRG